jgi:hypothetical protein
MTASRDFLNMAFIRSERIVGRRIAGEYVLVPIMGSGAEVDSIFTLNRVATFIWERLDGRATGADLVGALEKKFDVDAERARTDYCEFVEKLQSIRAVAAAEHER